MDATEPRPDLGPLKFWERGSLLTFLAVLIAFGVILEIRCVFMPNRQTDLGCYLRAAWAARAGENPYDVVDDNGWHFAYPPVVTLLFMPLADAPAGADRMLLLPWSVSVQVWYLLSLASLMLAVHWIARALEATSADPAIRTMPAGCRRWWYNRMLPILVCLVQIGGTLSRGQVNILVILGVAGAFAALVQGQRFRSGLWLAAAMCLKVIPAFLVLFPLWRRDGRALAGVAVGLALGLFVIPALYWGVPQTIALNQHLVSAVLHPGLGQGGDQTRAQELTNITATDNQSFQAILHNYQYWGQLHLRPGQPNAWTRMAHWLIGGALTLAVLAAAGWRRGQAPVSMLMLLGSLLLLMTMVTPVSHLHYFAMAVPLVMALAAASLETRRGALLPGPATLGLLIIVGVGYALPSIPFWQNRREAGLPMFMSFGLLGAALVYLWARRGHTAASSTGVVDEKPDTQPLAA